ncbi:MAG: Fe-S cluster assembly protein SufD [Saprospiraceae bacterium]|jgi:Fe-S cluster assembly protein SufD
MATLVLSDKDKFLLNMEGQDFSQEAKTFIKLRERGFERLKNQEFPTKQQEDWKYTSVRDIAKSEFRPQSPINLSLVQVKEHYIPGLNAITLVFVNGFYQEQLSAVPEKLQEGLLVKNLNEAKKKHIKLVEPHMGVVANNPDLFFSNINAAYSQDGGFVHVKKDVTVTTPIHFLHLTEGDQVSSQPRNLLVAEANSSIKVVTTYETLSSESSFTNAVTEVFVGEGATVCLDKIQNEHDKAYNMSFEQANVAANGTFTINTVPVGGKIIRNNVNITLEGAGGEGNLYGMVCLNGDMHVDNQTYVDHVAPNCDSNEFYKSVVNDHAVNVFNGKIMVRKAAQKTNAFQRNANILQSDNGKINAKPQLEIYADDVKCSHGCTIGQFDKEALFYLRSRGIKESSAKKVLMEAFADEVLDNIQLEPVREYAKGLIHKNFSSLAE